MQQIREWNRGGFMADVKGFQPERFREVETPKPANELNSQSIILAIPERCRAELGDNFAMTTPACVRLGLEELKCFEIVEYQFERWGITFANAIAIQPSNPAFFVRPDTTVLMGAPKSGLIEIFFKYPVHFASALVTSSRRTVMSAYDAEGKMITQAELPAPNLVGSNSPIPPNAVLSVSAAKIYQISFYAFDGQIIVDDLTFKF
ncbi:MAG: hypothetical protein ACM37W_06205 [Actinomycetota bacterium]